MKQVMLFLLFFNSAWATLPEDHFLFPRDLLAIQLIGIENSMSRSQLKRHRARCLNDLFQNETCSILNDFYNPANHQSSTQSFWNPQTQIIFFGERHIDQQLQQELSAQLINLHQDGFDHLALEMFNSSAQEQIDAYLNNELSIEQILVVLGQDWSYRNEGYRLLLETAKSQGMKIIGIDNRRGNTNKLSFSEDLIRRDIHMASVLSQYLDEKLIVYTGRLHSYHSFSLQGQPVVKTIISELKNYKPGLEIETYFLSIKRSSGLFAKLLQMDNAPIINGVFKSPTLQPYIDGFVLSRYP
jgi:hypothetical protein